MAACQSHYYVQEQIRSGDPTCRIFSPNRVMWVSGLMVRQGHVRGPQAGLLCGGPAPHPVFLLGLASRFTAGVQDEWEPDGQTDTCSLWCRERPPHPLGSRCIQVGSTLEPVPTQLRDEGRGMVASVTA